MVMFTYFGSKLSGSMHGHYPEPRYGTIVEPFAGSAGYSRVYGLGRRVVLIERDAVIVRIWKWLQEVKPEDFRALPCVRRGEPIPKIKPIEAQWFLGLCAMPRTARPRMTAGYGMSKTLIGRIERGLPMIRSWDVRLGDWWEAPDIEATWFVDPPYQNQRESVEYRHREVDYARLADWCRARQGQVIVCESDGADWLPFTPTRVHTRRTPAGVEKYTEMMWTNTPFGLGFFR